MLKKILFPLVQELLLSVVTPDLMRELLDQMLDTIENAIEATPSRVDDKIALPLIATIRTAFNVPDDDD